jgi:hypothetical protein
LPRQVRRAFSVFEFALIREIRVKKTFSGRAALPCSPLLKGGAAATALTHGFKTDSRSAAKRWTVRAGVATDSSASATMQIAFLVSGFRKLQSKKGGGP